MFSLVTACMNRESHLRANLPRWLALPNLAEVVIVDWSNLRCLGELRAVDPRVKIVRVADEPKWILSYAYNLGIASASQPFILKCDADCAPNPGVMTLAPGSKWFYAGYWRSGAAVGKPSVNGQCVFSREQFEAVNGYSEIIRSYGRDDEDFYDRLIGAGFARRELAPAWLEFVDHSEAERTANQFATETNLSLEQRVLRGTLYNEMHNYYLARQIPWGRDQRRATFREIQREDRLTVFRRDPDGEISIPDTVKREAHLFALRFVAAQRAGIPGESAERLDERACLTLIGARSKAAAKPGVLLKSA